MARMHARRKGKSGSNKPVTKETPKWVNKKSEEIKSLIKKMKKKGHSLSRIGLKLRDEYGVPSVKAVTGKKIGKIVKEQGLSNKFPDDLMSLMKKAVKLHKHLENNNHDIQNKRAIQLIESKIHRLVKYYKNVKRLPKEWIYSYERAKLLVE